GEPAAGEEADSVPRPHHRPARVGFALASTAIGPGKVPADVLRAPPLAVAQGDRPGGGLRAPDPGERCQGVAGTGSGPGHRGVAELTAAAALERAAPGGRSAGD